MDTEFDSVIRGGTVFDGSGGEPFVGDVGIRNGKIAAVGQITGRGAEEIDATGRIVTPGFVDIHTHYDGQITWEHTLSPSSQHGITTAVMGNCGVGFAPCKPEHRELLVRVMEGVEDIPEVVMTAGIPWTWESFPDYLNVLDTREADMDFAAQVPHAAARVNVMGQRGADREPPTQGELAQMTRIVAEGVRAGGIGVSTSRSIGHKTTAGQPAPTTASEEDELIALARGLKEAGTGVFQLISGAHEGSKEPVAEMAMLQRLIEASGRPLSFTMQQTNHKPHACIEIMEQLSLATARGVPIKAQVFPRPVGILFGLELSFHPFKFNPSYKAIANLPLPERVERMRKPDVRARILAEKPEHTNSIFLYFASQAEDLYPLGEIPDYEPIPDSTIGEQAKRLGISARELAYDRLLEQDGHATLFFAASNYVTGSLEPVREMLEHPDTLIGLGDGGAHYGMISDASYPTHLLAYWTRDRTQGTKLGLPWAINALSRRNAVAVGMIDRGLIAPGMKADINVIDYDRIQLRAPRVNKDLPAGGSRLFQGADGYELTMVSGVVTYRCGVHTGALPGKLVRSNGPAFAEEVH